MITPRFARVFFSLDVITFYIFCFHSGATQETDDIKTEKDSMLTPLHIDRRYMLIPYPKIIQEFITNINVKHHMTRPQYIWDLYVSSMKVAHVLIQSSNYLDSIAKSRQ